MSEIDRARRFRQTTTILLTVLVVGTLILVAAGLFDWIRRENAETQELVRRVSAYLEQSERNREKAGEIATRLLRLEARRTRLAAQIQTCTIVTLQGGSLPRCRGIRAEAERLARVIQHFRDRLAASARSSGGGGGGGGGPGTVTRTTTATRAPSPPPQPRKLESVSPE